MITSRFACFDIFDLSHSELTRNGLFEPFDVSFEIGAISDDVNEVHPSELQVVEHVALKRRHEFISGRRCFRRAALRYFDTLAHPILIDKNRAPKLPPGLKGSISHSNSFAGAAVSTSGIAQGIGLDIEDLITPFPMSTLPVFCQPSEQKHVERLPKFQQDLAAFLVFSLKESIYKCFWSAFSEDLSASEINIELSDKSFNRGNATVRRKIKGASAPSLFLWASRTESAVLTGALIPNAS